MDDQVDHVLVADNGSTDGTRQLVDWNVPFDADSSGGLGGPTSLRL
jgi:hypothetical protein